MYTCLFESCLSAQADNHIIIVLYSALFSLTTACHCTRACMVSTCLPKAVAGVYAMYHHECVV